MWSSCLKFSTVRNKILDTEKFFRVSSLASLVNIPSSFHCMLCCSDSESKWWIHISSWITNCEINFCWVTSVSFKKFFRILCAVLVLAFSTSSDRHFVHFAYRVLSLTTIRSKHYFNYILNKTRPGRELFDRYAYVTWQLTTVEIGWISQNCWHWVPKLGLILYKLRSSIGSDGKKRRCADMWRCVFYMDHHPSPVGELTALPRPHS